MDYSSLKETKSIKVSTKELTQIQVADDDSILAVGSRDSNIYIYSVVGLKKVAVCKGHHSTIRHFDFAKNSRTLQSACTSYELLYWDARTGKQDTKGASNNRDEPWSSWTCTLGWPVQGVYPPCSDGLDVNAVDRSSDGQFLVTGDDFSYIKLFRVPNFKGSSYLKFIGHSSHVTNVKFSHDDNYIISTGGHDKSIFQWRFTKGTADSQKWTEDQDDEFTIKREKKVEANDGLFDI